LQSIFADEISGVVPDLIVSRLHLTFFHGLHNPGKVVFQYRMKCGRDMPHGGRAKAVSPANWPAKPDGAVFGLSISGGM
jgi:hypothetical protein